jgi:hypothetical protein
VWRCGVRPGFPCFPESVSQTWIDKDTQLGVSHGTSRAREVLTKPNTSPLPPYKRMKTQNSTHCPRFSTPVLASV